MAENIEMIDIFVKRREGYRSMLIGHLPPYPRTKDVIFQGDLPLEKVAVVYDLCIEYKGRPERAFLRAVKRSIRYREDKGC